MSVPAAIRKLISEGFTADQAIRAAEVMEEAFSGGMSGGNPVDTAAERRRAWDRERKAKARAEQSMSGGNPVEVPNGANIEEPTLSISTGKLEELGGVGERVKSKRGSRLPDLWMPSKADLEFAASLGWNGPSLDLKIMEFKNYWSAEPGAKACKLDWSKTFRNRLIASKPAFRQNGNHRNERSGSIFESLDRLEAGLISRSNYEPEESERSDSPDNFGGRLQLVAVSNF